MSLLLGARARVVAGALVAGALAVGRLLAQGLVVVVGAVLQVDAKDPGLEVAIVVVGVLLGAAAAVPDALGPLPALGAGEEEDELDDHDGPLPGDALVLEHLVVDHGDVHGGEDGDEADHDGPEQEAVHPDVADPARQDGPARGPEVEEGPARVHHLPGQEQGEPGQAGKGGGSGAEHQLALGRVLGVTVVTEFSVAETVDDHDEGGQTASRHPETVHGHVQKKFGGEDTDFELCRGKEKYN